MTKPIEIDVFSDPICPWCYIGKKRLDLALETYYRPLEARITWRCFQLNPSMPAEGMSRQAYLSAKFGGPERAEQIYGNIKKAGADCGIDFQFGAIQKTPNTIKAHRLIRLAQSQQADATGFLTALFKAYFLLGRDIGDEAELKHIAVSSGLEACDIDGLFSGDDLQEEVLEEEETARSMGLSGVPFYVLGSRYAISGAQDATAFHKLFDTLLAE